MKRQGGERDTVLLENKTILVVPATFGLGFEAALRFAREGARLVICGEREDNATRALAFLREQVPGCEAIHCPVTLTREEGFERAVEQGVRHFGALDGAFGCPDHFVPGLLEQLETEAFDLAVARNVRSLHFLVRHLAPALEAAGGGAIVLLSSLYARVSGSTSAAYEISKGMVACMARSYGEIYAARGVRINAVLCGHYVLPERDLIDEHPIYRPTTTEEELALARHYPIGRLADADEIAQAAAWLLSDRASYACGSELLLDGALTRR